jgi:hypothetical protein
MSGSSQGKTAESFGPPKFEEPKIEIVVKTYAGEFPDIRTQDMFAEGISAGLFSVMNIERKLVAVKFMSFEEGGHTKAMVTFRGRDQEQNDEIKRIVMFYVRKYFKNSIFNFEVYRQGASIRIS